MLLPYGRPKACTECHRRKKKCEIKDGGKCVGCKARGLDCSLYQANITTINPLSPYLMADAELTKYLDLTWNLTPFSFSIIALGLDLDSLSKSSSNSHKFIVYSAAAISARACGNEKHAKSLISDAMTFSNALDGDYSVPSLVGFCLLSYYWLGTEDMKKFANGALKIFQRISQNKGNKITHSQYTFMSVCQALTSSLEPNAVINEFLNFDHNGEPMSNEEVFYVSVTRIYTKILGVGKLDYQRIDGLAILLCHVTYTEEQRRGVLYEVETIRQLLTQQPKSLYIQSLALDYLTIFVNWRSGYRDLAVYQAIQFAKHVSPDLLLFGSKFEGIELIAVSLLLYEYKHYELAHKLYKISSILHSLFQHEHSIQEECIQMFSSFIADSLSQSPPPSPDTDADSDSSSSSSSSTTTTTTTVTTITPNTSQQKIQAMVDKILSLVSLFTTDPKKLVSLHGIYIWYKTFSSLCPLQPSTYQLHPLAVPLSHQQPVPETNFPKSVDDLALFDSILFGPSLNNSS